MIRAGQLRHRAVVQEPVRTENATGEEVVTYQDCFEAFAEIKGIRGVMVENAKQVAPESTHKIMMRYGPNNLVNESHRILICSREYDVLFVDDIKLKGRWLEIHVKQRKGAYGDKSGY